MVSSLERIRLTQLASCAGCAAKMGPDRLAQALLPLTADSHPDLLVGLQTSDDAAVFRMNDEQAIVQTVDFFPPIVDDPYSYGAIAAANSMSDVFAMNGSVLLALSVAAFPAEMPIEAITSIFEGAADKVREAGGIIAGGHTVIDAEPKYGLSVTGTVHPDRIWTKAGARPGDELILTKPLGTGLITTALKNGAASADHVADAVQSDVHIESCRPGSGYRSRDSRMLRYHRLLARRPFVRNRLQERGRHRARRDRIAGHRRRPRLCTRRACLRRSATKPSAFRR